jgi:hypothetical protein
MAHEKQAGSITPEAPDVVIDPRKPKTQKNSFTKKTLQSLYAAERLNVFLRVQSS